MRYSDDGGGIVDESNAEHLFNTLNNWGISIVIKRKDYAFARKVHLLDVEIEADHHYFARD